MASPGLMELIADASGDNPARLPAALMSSGVVLSAAALSLIVFKALGGSFLRLHGSTLVYSYYGVLVAVVIYGLAVVSFSFWVVPRDPVSWRAAGKTVLWVSLLPFVVVAALGGLALLE